MLYSTAQLMGSAGFLEDSTTLGNMFMPFFMFFSGQESRGSDLISWGENQSDEQRLLEEQRKEERFAQLQVSIYHESLRLTHDQ